jgi:hypothetical protein
MRKPKFYEWLTIVLPRLVSDIAEDVREIVRYCREEDIRRQLAPQNKKPVTVQATGTAVYSAAAGRYLRRWTSTYGETVFCEPGQDMQVDFHVSNKLEGPIQVLCHGGIITDIRIGQEVFLLGSCVSATLDGPVEVAQHLRLTVRAL